MKVLASAIVVSFMAVSSLLREQQHHLFDRSTKFFFKRDGSRKRVHIVAEPPADPANALRIYLVNVLSAASRLYRHKKPREMRGFFISGREWPCRSEIVRHPYLC